MLHIEYNNLLGKEAVHGLRKAYNKNFNMNIESLHAQLCTGDVKSIYAAKQEVAAMRYHGSVYNEQLKDVQGKGALKALLPHAREKYGPEIDPFLDAVTATFDVLKSDLAPLPALDVSLQHRMQRSIEVLESCEGSNVKSYQRLAALDLRRALSGYKIPDIEAVELTSVFKDDPPISDQMSCHAEICEAVDGLDPLIRKPAIGLIHIAAKTMLLDCSRRITCEAYEDLVGDRVNPVILERGSENYFLAAAMEDIATSWAEIKGIAPDYGRGSEPSS